MTPGAEVPPLFHLGALGARGVSFRQGDRWKARLTLPLAADRGGRALAVTLPADVEYEGVAVRSGIRCAAFRVRGTAPRELPPALREHYPQADGTLTGVVWVELATGVVVAADLDSTLRFAGTVEKTDETLTVTARLQIARR